MSPRSRLFSLFGLLVLLSLILAACAPAAAPTTAPQEPATGGSPAEKTIVRFVIAPDPLLKYMLETGVVEKYENRCNMSIKIIQTWDEVAFFGGGHADIASTGDYEVPSLMAETGKDFVVFGNYNVSRVPIFVKTDSPYQTIQDLKGKKIGVPGPLSSTMIWGVMLKQTEGVDFRVGSSEFDLVVNEHVVNAELLRRGEIEAGIIVPEALIPELREGTVRTLYGVGGGWDYYRDNFDPGKKHKGVPSNIFLARKEWFEQNKPAAQCFLAMWEEGVDIWQANRHDLIRLYPEDWGIDPNSETFEEDVDVMFDWLTKHDWFVDTVYLDQAWIDKELPLFDHMRKGGFMEADMPNPDFVALEPMQ
jgi:ABC-type nitrate/sulfonate/bicarbonate transport system substrate-binding protein